MRGLRRISIFAALPLAVALFSGLLAGHAAAQQTYNWRLQSVWLTKATQDGLKLFAENVKKATGGKVNIKVYQANQLVKIKATRDAVQTGAIEMACEAGAYLARVVPEANVEFGLPFSWRSWDEAWEAWTKYGLREMIREAYAEKGLYLVTIQPAGNYCLMTTKPVRKVSDLRGMKIRTWGLAAHTLKALGASPTMIPGAEQYVALQRGTVDGTVYPVFVLDAYKLKEVIRYVMLPSVISPPTTNIYMNLDLWKSLPKEIQDQINQAATLHQKSMQERYLRETYVAVGRFVMEGYGDVIPLPDSEVKKIRKAAFAAWDRLAKKSPRCKALVEAMKKFMADKGITLK
jgi:TRAP-type C4-dicarboxylate transport system substrate-binding protein